MTTTQRMIKALTERLASMGITAITALSRLQEERI